MPAVNDVATQLISHGVLGPIVVALAIAYRQKDKQLQDCMESRTNEAVEATKQMGDAANAMKASAEALKENTQAIRDMSRR